jgi:DNA polymerase I-like protein with 3'-5' exonuclease and polymerase domains
MAKSSKLHGFMHPLFMPVSTWKAPDISTLPSWESAKRVCVDVETRDPTLKELGIGVRRNGYVVGISFTIEDGPTAYLPIRHEGGDNLPEDQVLRYLRDNAKIFKGDVVGANLSYDLDYLWQEGIDFPNKRFYRDIQIADPLIYELHQSYSLQSIALRYGFAGKDERLLQETAREFNADPKADLWKMPARFVGPYAEADTQQPLLVLRKQERIIDEEDLWDIYNLESQVLPVLVKLRRRGVKIDQDKLSQVEKWAYGQEKDALAIVKHESGVSIAVGDVWKSDGLIQALESIGIKLEKLTAKGKQSVAKDVLADIDHPVAKALTWARKTNKLRTTFAGSVREHMVNGRIHCTYNQLAREDDKGEQKGARFGRLSCVDPNLQQQPSKDEFAKMWRSIYIPEPDHLWASCDYSQQEPRWTTHYAAVCNLPLAEIAAKAYRDDPLLDNHKFMAELTNLPRSQAKNIFLGLCYGEGGAKLSNDLGLPTRWAISHGKPRKTEFYNTKAETMARRKELGDGYVYEAAGQEGQRIIDTFNERAPFIGQLAKLCQNKAKESGRIITGGGRKLNFPEQDDGSYDWTHKALNRLIQGTSADQTKKALVALDAAGYFIQLQVHDEITASVKSREEAEGIAEIMRTVMPAKVPFRVDVEIGDSWGGSMA